VLLILGIFVDKMGNICYARVFIVYLILAILCITMAMILKTTYAEE
jgi:hypothetical protein